ncbi:MAG: type II toxin-antitoxin system RelE/ParE family toxin [Lachnospiraceae bacterium]|nr:type II toxin-antitoxin system RelE/ParE family toxin [Lachnospiraceae bacterium]
MPYDFEDLCRKYKIKYTYSSRDDIRRMKKYILDQFKYRELSENFTHKNFTHKMKEAANSLKTLPSSYDTVGFQYRGYDIHLKPYRNYLFFFIVDEEETSVTVLRVLQDGMNWQFIIKRWLKQNE